MRSLSQSRRSFIGLLLLSVLLIVALAAPVWAQAVSGSQVSGTVRDASGGALPGAEVTITKVDTGQTRTVLLEGLAGHSKTSVVEAFLADVDEAAVGWGP